MSGRPDSLDRELLFICHLILWLFQEFLKRFKSFSINSPKQYKMLFVLLNLPISTRSRKNFIQKLVQILRNDDQSPSVLWFDIDFPYLKLFFKSILNLVRDLRVAATKRLSMPWSPNTFLGTPPMHFTHSKYCVQAKLEFLFDLIPFSQRLWRLKSSIALWVLKPYGFSLSYPSICQTHFGHLAKYSRLRKCFLRLSSTPSGSNSLIIVATVFLVTLKPPWMHLWCICL